MGLQSLFGNDPVLQSLLFFVGVVGGVVLLILTAMRLFGFGFDAEHDTGSNADGGDAGHGVSVASFLSIQGLGAFFAMFGLVGFGMMRNGSSAVPSLGTGAIVGVAAVFIMASLMRAMSTLNESGSMEVGDLQKADGVVSTPVPPREEGIGLVQLTVKGVQYEYQAYTSGERMLPIGTRIRVAEVRGSNQVLVTPVNAKH
jgi:hypothetical protein